MINKIRNKFKTYELVPVYKKVSLYRRHITFYDSDNFTFSVYFDDEIEKDEHLFLTTPRFVIFDKWEAKEVQRVKQTSPSVIHGCVEFDFSKKYYNFNWKYVKRTESTLELLKEVEILKTWEIKE